MAKKNEAYPVTFSIKCKVAKEANLDKRQKAALKGYVDEFLEGIAVDGIAGNSNGKISITKTGVVVMDFAIFDLTPPPNAQRALPGHGEEGEE